MAEAANVAKYNAGGSGDNIIADGYIKTVEKVWIDSYTIAFTNTNTTIDIAVLPPNKKITGIDVEILTTGSHTSGTVSIGFSTDANVDTFLTPHTFTHNLTRSSISLPGGGGYAGPTTTGVSVAFLGAFSGYQFVTTGTQVTVSVKLNNWISTMTTGTVKSIVRYT